MPRKKNQNNDCENSNFQISTNNQNLKMLNMKNNDDIDLGENTQKYSSEFSVNREDDSFNINLFNNSILNSLSDKSNYNFLYNINFIGYMPFETNLKSNEVKEIQKTVNTKNTTEMIKEKQLAMKEKELIEKETALNMKEKEMREKIEKELREKIEKELREKIEKELREKIEKELREKIQQEFREKEILKKEEKKEKKI